MPRSGKEREVLRKRCGRRPVPPDPRPRSFLQLGWWLDGEAAARLQEMGTEEWSPDSFQGSAERFNEFLVQATVRLRGLSVTCMPRVSLPAALLGGSGPCLALRRNRKCQIGSVRTSL